MSFINQYNEIENCLSELEKKEREKCIKMYRIDELNDKLIKTDNKLNKEILCEGCCKEKEIRKLADKCGNEEIAKFLYECRLNRERYDDDYIRWIPFDEFKNIKYLTKDSFGEVYEAIWVSSYYDYREKEYKDREVVLERIHNSNDKIIDILKEVKKEFIVIIIITLKQK